MARTLGTLATALAAVGALLPASALAQAALPPVVAAVSPVPFFKHADFGKLELSPSGKHIAVEWVVYQEEAHGFLLEANRYGFYGRVAKFLDANLGSK
jgi:hypothetical protein